MKTKLKPRMSKLQALIISVLRESYSNGADRHKYNTYMPEDLLKSRVNKRYIYIKHFDTVYNRAIQKLLKRNLIKLRGDKVNTLFVSFYNQRNLFFIERVNKENISCYSCKKVFIKGEFAIPDSSQFLKYTCLDCSEKYLRNVIKVRKIETNEMKGQLMKIRRARKCKSQDNIRILNRIEGEN